MAAQNPYTPITDIDTKNIKLAKKGLWKGHTVAKGDLTIGGKRFEKMLVEGHLLTIKDFLDGAVSIKIKVNSETKAKLEEMDASASAIHASQHSRSEFRSCMYNGDLDVKKTKYRDLKVQHMDDDGAVKSGGSILSEEDNIKGRRVQAYINNIAFQEHLSSKTARVKMDLWHLVVLPQTPEDEEENEKEDEDEAIDFSVFAPAAKRQRTSK